MNGYPVLIQTTFCTPAFYSIGRYIELDVQVADEARLDFHSCNTSSGMDYDARIVCNSGLANNAGGRTRSFEFYAS